MVVVELVIKIIVAIALGFFLYKIKVLNDGFNSTLSRFIVELTSPCMIFAAIVSIGDEAPQATVWNLLIVGFIIYAILIVLAFLLTKLIRVQKFSAGAFQCLIVFGNVGFIGIPIVGALFGPLAKFYMAVLNIHMNLFMYSYGLWLITRHADGKYKFSAKRLINPTNISVVIALIIFFCGLKLPDIAVMPFDYVGSVTPFMSLVALGSSAASRNLKKIFSNWRFYVFTAIKMILIPLGTFLLCMAVIGPGMITNVITLYVGMPAALAPGMFAMAYGGDKETAVGGANMMNLFCVVTVPLMYIMMTSL